MVAQFVKLKLTLLGNSFKRSTWQTIGFVLGALYGLFIVVMVTVALIGLGTADLDLGANIIVLAGALLVVAWWVVPLLMYGVDATLDPQRFVLYAIPRRQLMLGLVAAGLFSIPAIVTVLIVFGSTLAWWRAPAALLASLIGGAVGIVTCVVGSRATTTAAAQLLESRRYREIATLVAFVPIILLGPALSWLMSQFANDASNPDAVRDSVATLAESAGWTPFGAPWAVGAKVYDGDWLGALARLAIAIATVGVLWLVWDRALARALVTPPSAGQSGRGRGLGWFGRLPASPRWAITARCLTYWFRDARYTNSWVLIPLMPVILLFVGRGTDYAVLLVLGPFVGWVLGYAISADISYDYTAFALHVSSGVQGRDDRWGRVYAVGIVGVPIVVFLVLVSVGLAGRWNLLPAILGASLGIMFSTLGVASVASAQTLYPVPKPGDSPFKQPQGSSMATFVSQMVTMTVVLVVALPTIGLTIAAIATGSAPLQWVTLLVGLALGITVLVGGVRWGSRVYDQRAPEILQQVMSWA